LESEFSSLVAGVVDVRDWLNFCVVAERKKNVDFSRLSLVDLVNWCRISKMLGEVTLLKGELLETDYYAMLAWRLIEVGKKGLIELGKKANGENHMASVATPLRYEIRQL
jgi:hypothetical protein